MDKKIEKINQEISKLQNQITKLSEERKSLLAKENFIETDYVYIVFEDGEEAIMHIEGKDFYTYGDLKSISGEYMVIKGIPYYNDQYTIYYDDLMDEENYFYTKEEFQELLKDGVNNFNKFVKEKFQLN